MSRMNYKKCKDCPHCDWFYAMGGGLYFICKILGDMLEIDGCPKEQHECKCGSCKRFNND